MPSPWAPVRMNVIIHDTVLFEAIETDYKQNFGTMLLPELAKIDFKVLQVLVSNGIAETRTRMFGRKLLQSFNTVLEAVEVSKQAKIQYLWVDRYCIM